MPFAIISFVLAFLASLFAPAQAVAQRESFITVEGANLRAKYETALRMGRSASPQTPFWTAHSFDVRPGVAVDPVQSGEFRGSMNNYGDITIFMGKPNGTNIETRNLGVFVLHEGNAVSRVEVYNLDRKREYSSYPVYWLGRGGNEESLNFLRGLAESNQPGKGSSKRPERPGRS